MKKFFEEFKAFALKGNVLDLAVGVMIGTAFGKITSSLVSDIFMPIIGLITGGLDFSGLFLALDGKSYPSVQAANDAGVGTLNYGAFITAVVDFVLIALCVFLFVKLAISKWRCIRMIRLGIFSGFRESQIQNKILMKFFLW